MVEGCMCGLLGHKICHFLTLNIFLFKTKETTGDESGPGTFPQTTATNYTNILTRSTV